MSAKREAPIREIKLNAATYDGEVIHPTLVNFIYGANGTGKSTIARIIDPTYPSLGRPKDIVWAPGQSADDYDILVFDQDFIDHNFHTYGNVEGVFTIGEENIQIQAEIDAKTDERAELQELSAQSKVIREQEQAQRQKLKSRFQDLCWDRAKKIRGDFPELQRRFRNKAAFTTELLEHAPAEHDFDELKGLYDTAFDADATTYPLFQIPEVNPEIMESAGAALLGKAITSSSDTDFSRFINAIGATDWVRLGHQQFDQTPGHKCPYCQQPLPPGFEEQITAAFDNQYHEDVEYLQDFQSEYADEMQWVLDTLRANISGTLPKLSLKVYRAKLALLAKTVDANNRLIAQKVKEPSTPITLEDTDTLMAEIAALAKKFNKQIERNNSIVAAQQDKQSEYLEQVWELAAFELAPYVKQFLEDAEEAENRIAELDELIANSASAIKALTAQIGELNHRTTTTAPTIEAINKLLDASGFQGFTLREKAGTRNVYEVVREDGTVATRLSEGERNFIAFLYFYHLVKGSRTPGGSVKDKIVVIDDPVSSMDSKAMTIVASLVRELVEVTLNNADVSPEPDEEDYVKQIIVLTHNWQFFNNVTEGYLPRYSNVSAYLVRKRDNTSSIELCVQPKPGTLDELENYSPALHEYAELWHRLKDQTSPIAVMNLMRRILTTYFLLFRGSHSNDVREVLEHNRDKFIIKKPNGRTDQTLFRLAESMLANTSSNPVAAMQAYPVDEHSDLDAFKRVFQQIFEALGQDQHYHMMMDGICEK